MQQKITVFYPLGIEDIWHHSADRKDTYRLDGIEKLLLLKNILSKDQNYDVVEVSTQNSSSLKLVHNEPYLTALKTGYPRKLAESSGLIWQENLFQVFSNSAHSLICAAREAMKGRQVGTLSKGGHHAIEGRGFGFNPINELAICVKNLKSEDPDIRIAVIDLDVHLGNGLHSLLQNEPNVLVLDLWSKSRPEWGKIPKSDNLIVHRIETKKDYWEKLELGLDTIVSFNPDIVLYHSGMDIYESDRLGGFEGFDKEEIERREKFVISSFPQNFVLVPGGGYVDYSDPSKARSGMENLVNLHKISFELLT